MGGVNPRENHSFPELSESELTAKSVMLRSAGIPAQRRIIPDSHKILHITDFFPGLTALY